MAEDPEPVATLQGMTGWSACLAVLSRSRRVVMGRCAAESTGEHLDQGGRRVGMGNAGPGYLLQLCY